MLFLCEQTNVQLPLVNFSPSTQESDIGFVLSSFFFYPAQKNSMYYCNPFLPFLLTQTSLYVNHTLWGR